MKGGSIIKNLTSVLLICIFAISNTPKSAFHKLIANHNDECFDNHQFKGTQLTKQGNNCHFENLVVESPFIWQPFIKQDLLHLFNTIYQSGLQIDVFSHYPIYSTLRGPPCFI